MNLLTAYQKFLVGAVKFCIDSAPAKMPLYTVHD